jgi:hypothetical protein
MPPPPPRTKMERLVKPANARAERCRSASAAVMEGGAMRPTAPPERGWLAALGGRRRRRRRRVARGRADLIATMVYFIYNL